MEKNSGANAGFSAPLSAEYCLEQQNKVGIIKKKKEDLLEWVGLDGKGEKKALASSLDVLKQITKA